VVGIDIALVANEVVPPNLQGVYYSCEFKVVGRVVLFVFS
jgi:hypothetical protein